MEIIELNMADYLGRGIMVWLNDGRALNFKPMELTDAGNWTGYTDEMEKVTICKNEILFVKGVR